MEYIILITGIVRNVCILQCKESKLVKIKYATKKISSPQLKLSWTPWPIEGATAEYPATIDLDFTCTHFKEQEISKNKLTQVAGYSTVKPYWVSMLQQSIFWKKQ